jgi:hypothetical protein
MIRWCNIDDRSRKGLAVGQRNLDWVCGPAPPANARKLIEGEMKRHRSNVRVFPKYAWLARYQNASAADFPDFKVEPIPVAEIRSKGA